MEAKACLEAGVDVLLEKPMVMNADEARELLLFIAQYAGYPRAASMLLPLEEAISEAQQEAEKE